MSVNRVQAVDELAAQLENVQREFEATANLVARIELLAPEINETSAKSEFAMARDELLKKAGGAFSRLPGSATERR